jgi:hypothetical protein
MCRQVTVIGFAILLLTMLGPSLARGADGPDTMVGSWVVESYWIDGTKIPAEKNIFAHTKEGTLWKLFDDGAGEILGYKQKWKYDKKKQSFTISQEGVFFGYNEWITNADVTKDGKNIVIHDTSLGHRLKIVLKPEEK